MKKIFVPFVLLIALSACKKSGHNEQGFNRSKADSLTRLLKKYVSRGIPGAVIAVKDGNGSWAGAEGFANLEDQTRMSTSMLQYGFSITKMVTAVAIMQLKEKGQIDLDQPVKNYLPASLQDILPNTDAVTVRMLLNHTSGYSDYARLDEFRESWILDPVSVRPRAFYLDMMKNFVTSSFTPGTDYLYSNTNFYLLALIIDKITGKPHGEWFKKQIFEKLQIQQTFYKNSPGYPAYSLPNVYWPGLLGTDLENITVSQQAWAKSEEYGATGLIASPQDFIRLLEGLNKGELVSPASLNEMRQWVKGSNSQEPEYGLGLGFWGYKGRANYGHDGDGIGATIELLYFPTSNTYVLAAANASTEFGGEIAGHLLNFRNEIGEYLAGF